jgi:hypothetical protein
VQLQSVRLRLAKAHDAVKNNNYKQRFAQHEALLELRKIKYEGVDDSQYIHTLTYLGLTSEQFREITVAECLQLERCVSALKTVSIIRIVADAKMRVLLSEEQYADYINSFDSDLSHIESEQDGDMPSELFEYIEKVRAGDKYTRIANMFRRTTKRDYLGRTAFTRYSDKAFSFYEEAVMDLLNALELDPKRNPLPNVQLAGEIEKWLDRTVSTKDGEGPDISASGVPRIRGSKSKFTLMSATPVVGERLRKHWRQRESLANCALELMYDYEELEKQSEIQMEIDSTLLKEKILQLKSRRS